MRKRIWIMEKRCGGCYAMNSGHSVQSVEMEESITDSDTWAHDRNIIRAITRSIEKYGEM